ncbi:hypothetical protein ABMA27_004163 [Loxostege sticticalis]|uniref:Reverse transcriptase domain-containing protein n=1 Tax=Loxostege sticticalis TaxID=481309 RepID=A0ABR3HMJ9_LOXSC
MFPDRWKIAHVIPIFKAGDKTSCSNYRPISILSCLAKLFESLVYASLYSHLNNYICTQQHGFVKNRSTLSNLLEFKHYLCQTFASCGQVDAIYLDFSKAFDKVNHSLLCQKLSLYGIHGCLLRWITSYLSNRSQLVTVKGYSSSPIPVSSGVPQGSHLGPLLFVIFINDLTERLSSPALLYADDLKIFTSIVDEKNCLTLQNDLNVVANWCSSNLMYLNIDKCCVITFTRKKNKIIHSYYIHDTLIDRKDVVRDLGVLFDEQLTFRPHYEQIIQRGNQLLGFIMRTTKHFKKPRSTLYLFNSLVRSVLEYCSPVWSPFYNVHINNIEKIQKRCLRYLSRKHNFGRSLAGYSQRLSKFDVIPLCTRRRRYDLLCLHKILHAIINAPNLLSSLNINTLHRSRRPNVFSIQVYRNNTSYYNPLIRMCRAYNELVRSGRDVDIFNDKFSVFKKAISEILKDEVSNYT